MTDLLLPFGYRVADGRMVEPTDVPRGLECGCVCPKCGRRLIAKHGDVWFCPTCYPPLQSDEDREAAS